MARMNHELRNRQARARDSLRMDLEDERRQHRLDQAARPPRRTFIAEVARGTRDDDSRLCNNDRKRQPKLAFPGTLDQLKRALRPLKLDGAWINLPNGVWSLRCWNRAVVNWAETSGALWFQGPKEEAAGIERRVRKRLRAWLRRQMK